MSLSDDNVKIEVLRLDEEGFSQRYIAEVMGVGQSTVNDFLARRTHCAWWDAYVKPIASGKLDDHHKSVRKLPEKTFIITSAQNNTYVHSTFLESLETMAERFDARIIVGTFTYNKTAFQNLEKGAGDWYDPKIVPYVLDDPCELAEGLLWCGELNILPTAVSPFSGLQSYTKASSGIIPHAKMQMESVATHKADPARMLYTTGAVTKRNYVEKKAGQKASFHHIFGALIVEVDEGGDWFVRQLSANKQDGSFYDMDTLYTPTGYTTGHSVEGIVWGDMHTEKKDEQTYDVSFGERPDSLLNRLRPSYQFVHDCIDFTARNHHNIKDPYFRFEAHVTGKDSVEDNILESCNTLSMLQRPYSQVVVVESNHDQAFRKWLQEACYKNDPENAIFFLQNQLECYLAIERGEKDFSIFEHAVKAQRIDLDDVIFLKTDESFTICNEHGGIECGEHSHRGANGSRGSMKQYAKLGRRYNIGHSHSAGIFDGVYQAGVSGSLEMGYNVGQSSWSHSHILNYRNGKRAIVTVKNGKHSRQQVVTQDEMEVLTDLGTFEYTTNW